jgi:hypothetical protein
MNWRLIFSGAKSPAWVLCSALSIVTVLLLSVWLMRLERRMVSRTVGRVLLGLRIAVLAVIMTLLLQPVLTTQRDVTKRGRVIVAVDASKSMEIHDTNAPLGEKLRWAQALGMLGNQETDTLIQQWVASADAAEEPNWLGNAQPPTTPAEQSAAEARKRQVDSSLSELTQMPRTEFVRRLLQSQPRELLQKLQGLIGVDVRLFATEQKAAASEELASLLQSERIEILPGNTDVLNVLQAVTSEDGSDQVKAIVLLTDGRQSVPGDLTSTAQLLSSLRVPVYAIPIGSRIPPRDLSIASVDAPEAIFLNDKAQIQATLTTFGFEGEPLTIRLEQNGRTVEEKQLTASADSAVATFSVPSTETGRFDYRIVADRKDGELRDDNNSRDVTLHVVNNNARVMLLDGDPRWEFRYLKNLLERDKQVESSIVLFRQPFLNLLDDSYIASKLPPLDAFAQELTKTDLLIIGDVLPDSVEPGVWEMVEKAVSRDGLTVVIIPGRQSMPHEFQSAILSGLLPVKEFSPRVAEQFQKSALDSPATSYHLKLSADAFHLPMFQLSDSMTLRDPTLTELPGHQWIYGGIPKSGATLWASSRISGDSSAVVPTIVHHDYGFGQVVWMGIDSTWRWRMRSGDARHYRFWGQLIRWAARNKSAAGNDDVRMTLSDTVIGESEQVDAIVRWNPERLHELQGATIKVVATPIVPVAKTAPEATTVPEEAKTDANTNRDDAVEANSNSSVMTQFAATLESSSDSPERFRGRVPRLSPGLWQVELQVTGSALNLDQSIRTELLVRKEESTELANVSCNRSLLRQLAEMTGGEMIEPWNTDRLVSLLTARRPGGKEVQEQTLWDHWWALIVLFCLMMTEWVIRKLNGLA